MICTMISLLFVIDNYTLDNLVSCTLGMLACDFFYAGSKIAIYAWLVITERKKNPQLSIALPSHLFA